jgi:tetratricopeptide repeat protein 30
VLATKRIEQLRQATKNIQDARIQRDNDGIRKSLKEFDEYL